MSRSTRFFTWLDAPAIEELERAVVEAPEAREAQRRLAREADRGAWRRRAAAGRTRIMNPLRRVAQGREPVRSLDGVRGCALDDDDAIGAARIDGGRGGLCLRRGWRRRKVKRVG